MSEGPLKQTSYCSANSVTQFFIMVIRSPFSHYWPPHSWYKRILHLSIW